MLRPLLKHNLALWICSAVTACTAINAGNRDPYLAASGPTPLRFAQEIPEFNPAWLLPELDMGDGKNAKKAADEPKVEPEVKTEPLTQRVVEPEKPIEVPEPVSENLSEPTQPLTNIEPPRTEPSTGPISPQMLLRYFSRGGTNEVLVPYNVEFTPPVKNKESTGGSSAIYISE